AFQHFSLSNSPVVSLFFTQPKNSPLTDIEPVRNTTEPFPTIGGDERIEIIIDTVDSLPGDGCEASTPINRCEASSVINCCEPSTPDITNRTPLAEEFTNSTHSLNQIGFVNPLASSPEVSIFPPPGADQQPHSIISFEPLPTLVPPQHNVKRPPAYSEELVRQLSMQNWFDSSEFQFPRQQLHYVKEIGRGWFGKVVEGEARGLEESTGRTTSKVFVRILKEDASQAEKLFFLHEATPYRRLRHVNILRLMAACLESDPWLLVFESCSRGDLKEFLLSNEASREALLEQGITIKMAIDVATGLSYMIEDGFIHTDVAARNCLVTSELRVKIGDTGSSIDKYPGDYYVHGEVALPVRWCAPESLLCSDTSIQTCTVTEKCNVWSFGVLLWEIFEFGKLPYAELSDDQVITRVFGTEALRLPAPRAVNSHV
ncbi:serine/threonine-protein kinase LMTK1-like, partial [Diaphorina citri]|uniref:Serine/threonine-protein kinase LMTK1-like n=1 Tax=Diaphorina citri TaxID=121845 RepID=A0A3Q0JER1_DIACI